jgi:hypothetical protein
MIIYNVTIKVTPDISEEYLHWLQNEHLSEMMQTGLFSNYTICRLLEPEDPDGVTYVVQYHCDSMDSYHRYVNEHSTRMRQKGLDKFGNKMVAFRTIMEALPS